MATETYTLQELKNDIKETHGTKKEAPSYAQHEASSNIDRNYRKYCKSDKAFQSLREWAWKYYD